MPRAQKSSQPLKVGNRDAFITYEEAEVVDQNGERQIKRRKVELSGTKMTQQDGKSAANPERSSQTTTRQTKDGDNQRGVEEDALLYDDNYLNEMFDQPNNAHVQNVDPVLPGRASNRQTDYVQQFVDNVGELLQALLNREALPAGIRNCSSCDGGVLAAWRCRDCTMPQILCRRCIRHSHRSNPLHRFQLWKGSHFEDAPSWSVGCHILVPHLSDVPVCPGLKRSAELLENYEQDMDKDHERRMRSMASNTVPNHAPHSMSEEDVVLADNDIGQEAEEAANAALDEYMDRLYRGESPAGIDIPSVIDPVAPPSNENAVRPTEGGYSDQDRPNERLQSADFTADIGNIPTRDILLNSYVRVLHTTGIHHIALVVCSCQGDHHIPTDLLSAGFMPASFKRIRTLFTADLLNHYRLCNLEMKSSAYQYYNVLRRITNPLAPADVVNLYDEFRRMTRLWRWMKKLKWAGYGHNQKNPLQAECGELANFCVACPQDGKNLPADWRQRSEQWMYRHTYVADGNFKANHVRSLKPDSDVWLMDGTGMAPNRHDYAEYLLRAKNKNTASKHIKAACENKFHAIKMAQQSAKDCDITGKAAIACSRHGCYCPVALVDLFQGEQQKNIDYALLQAIQSTGLTPEQGLVFIYDIACQYTVHLIDRIGDKLPPDLQIQTAIGMFHVHGHKDECFFRFAPSFIPGTAITSGKILESLWSTLNGISGSLRTATLPHREEVLDDHACDSNHKKALGMAAYLCKRHTLAVDMHSTYKNYFENITQNCGAEMADIWTREVVNAEQSRSGKNLSMDIYIPKTLTRRQTTAQVDPEAANDPPAADELTPIKAWLQFTLHIEEIQLSVGFWRGWHMLILSDRIDILQRQRTMGRDAAAEERDKIDEMRESLTAMFAQLEVLQNLAGAQPAPFQGATVEFVGDDIDWTRREDDQVANTASNQQQAQLPNNATAYPPQALYTDDDPPQIEKRLLCLPSNGNTGGKYNKEELELRIEQAEKHLNIVRELVADKSFQFSALIRTGNHAVVTRSRAAIIKMNCQIGLHARTYNRIRCRLNMLEADRDTMSTFRFLEKKDVQSSTAILDFNHPGSSRGIHLSWIWQSPQSRFGPEIDSPNFTPLSDAATMMEFKRVHWLRGRAIYQRWREEEMLLNHEMQWTVRFFFNRSLEWGKSAQLPMISPGTRAYAARQSTQFHFLASHRLFYMESRLRVATKNILLTPAPADQIWKQKFLIHELQFALSYVGLAYTLAIKLELPPLLSAASPVFLFAASNDLPVDLDENIVKMIVTPCSPTDPWHDVGVYAYAWWNMEEAPADLHSNIVSSVTIMKCLEIHRAQLAAFTPPRRPYYATSVLSKMIPERPTHGCSACQINHSLARNCLTELATMYIISEDNVQFFQTKGRVVGAQIRSLTDGLPAAPVPNPNADSIPDELLPAPVRDVDVDGTEASRKAAAHADPLHAMSSTDAAPADQEGDDTSAYIKAAPPVIQHATLPDLDIDSAWASRKATSAIPPVTSKLPDLDIDLAWASRKVTSAVPPVTPELPDLDIDSAWASRKATSAVPPVTATLPELDIDSAWASRKATSAVPPVTATLPDLDIDSAWASRKATSAAPPRSGTVPSNNTAPAETDFDTAWGLRRSAKSVGPKMADAAIGKPAHAAFADIDIDTAWATRKADARHNPHRNKSSDRHTGQNEGVDLDVRGQGENSDDSDDSYSSINLPAITDPNVLRNDMEYFDTFVDATAFGEQVDQGETSDFSVEN
ncbi:hypothetical protein CPC08DRAFT_727731 [Agrocybe pediades]|nr:hypothetical protein CPC08DRAFT_727731 [Agrocybe pediades]